MLSIMDRTDEDDCSLWGRSLRSSLTAAVLMVEVCRPGVAGAGVEF